MTAEYERALSRFVYYQEAIEEARKRNESTTHLEEKLFAALVLVELNDLS